MFRRLLNLEMTALREQFDEFRQRVEDAEEQLADAARDLLDINRDHHSRGIWNFRSHV